MKRTDLFLFSLLISIFLFSCTPIYKCGEPKPANKLFLPKMVLTVINERDSLCTTLSAREVEVYKLKKDTTSLNNDIKELEKRYDNLTNDKLSQSDQFNAALKKKTEELKLKSDELKDKEKLLIDREVALNDMKKVVARQDSITNRLNKILHDALLGFKSDELSVEIKNGKVYVSMSDKLLFKSGSAAIETKGIEAIKVLADVLNKNNDIDILVEGHTDAIPIKTRAAQCIQLGKFKIPLPKRRLNNVSRKSVIPGSLIHDIMWERLWVKAIGNQGKKANPNTNMVPAQYNKSLFS